MTGMESFRDLGRPPQNRVYVIAEAGVNHNGSLDRARALIDLAVEAGADAVKFQTFDPEALVSRSAAKAAYQKANTGTDESQLEMLRQLALAPEDHAALRDHCRARGITFCSTPFDLGSARLLHGLDVPFFKISSGEVTNLGFLRGIAALGRPVILSTGMATAAEIRPAVEALAGVELALLHCVSNYPADPADMNLRAMDVLAETFGLPVGLSDHTPGITVSLAAAARGAVIIEKHFTLDRSLPGPDHAASLDPEELCALVREIRAVSAALGRPEKACQASESATADVARRSLHWAASLPAGAVVEPAHLTALRPGTGLAPAREGELVGRRTAGPVAAGTMVLPGDVEGFAP